jgi:hypothetical protein
VLPRSKILDSSAATIIIEPSAIAIEPSTIATPSRPIVSHRRGPQNGPIASIISGAHRHRQSTKLTHREDSSTLHPLRYPRHSIYLLDLNGTPTPIWRLYSIPNHRPTPRSEGIGGQNGPFQPSSCNEAHHYSRQNSESTARNAPRFVHI